MVCFLSDQDISIEFGLKLSLIWVGVYRGSFGIEVDAKVFG